MNSTMNKLQGGPSVTRSGRLLVAMAIASNQGGLPNLQRIHTGSYNPPAPGGQCACSSVGNLER